MLNYPGKFFKILNNNPKDYPQVRQVLEAKWLRIHIRNHIHVLKLSSFLSEEDVVQYAVMCLIEALEEGKQVNHPGAWSMVSYFQISFFSVFSENSYQILISNILFPINTNFQVKLFLERKEG